MKKNKKDFKIFISKIILSLIGLSFFSMPITTKAISADYVFPNISKITITKGGQEITTFTQGDTVEITVKLNRTLNGNDEHLSVLASDTNIAFPVNRDNFCDLATEPDQHLFEIPPSNSSIYLRNNTDTFHIQWQSNTSTTTGQRKIFAATVINDGGQNIACGYNPNPGWTSPVNDQVANYVASIAEQSFTVNAAAGSGDTGTTGTTPLGVPGPPTTPSDSGIWTQIHCTASDNPITCNLAKIINVLLLFAGILAMLAIIYGGIQYMTAAGDQEKSSKAKRTLIAAIVGIVVIIISCAALMFIKTTLQ
ncbi:MAG: hypothetical protein COX39_01155 [Candidatus Nealsonbacteria bacterium CG23_combo_of_CG06-09_8_20_14_all_40_13]|uniref:Uncharacterized protein n=1 Tax=Candidatus Nealsonbacteria bacterium CG23_combo_of_CG06-09_8_20_14_all_40_13 TaxID=1974724 RepID=A0A2G9YRD8_9BACT|nr:MAG: hypothetical protein COX39_01155 [Candidatus Nealsonbacteria bacterium CG23_combo_of_CG06-09_8_20_14_all_40_13]PIR70787.1 MAG: hypothetical protein COU44_03080 [Candidatus Nealsonbacteria bacterium CG10_big_fil_rev_8_21_14_0_10_40_24]